MYSEKALVSGLDSPGNEIPTPHLLKSQLQCLVCFPFYSTYTPNRENWILSWPIGLTE